METEWKKDILMSTKLCILDKYFRKHSFSFDKTHFVLMGTHYDAAFFPREALTIWRLYSFTIPFISRVVDSSREWLIAPPAPQYQTFPVVTQLYFTGSGVHCPSLLCLSYLYRQLAQAAPLLPSLAGFIIRQSPAAARVPPSPHFLPGPEDVVCGHHERHLQVEAGPGYLEA